MNYTLTEDMKYLLIGIISKEIGWEAETKGETEKLLKLIDLFEWAKNQETLPFT